MVKRRVFSTRLMVLFTGAVVLLLGPSTSVVQAGGSSKVKELKVEVCHIPPDNPNNPLNITVGASALQDHLDHGDYVGECAGSCAPVGTACTQETAAACCTGLCSTFPGQGCCLPAGVACDGNNPGGCCSGACQILPVNQCR
jgi:hypothetical protein